MHIVDLLLMPIQRRVPCKYKYTGWLETGSGLILPDALSRVVSEVTLWSTLASPAREQYSQGREITQFIHFIILLLLQT